MRSPLSFVKYSGAGNDFILIDRRNSNIPRLKKETIIQLCDRHQGVGADGVICLDKSDNYDFKMTTYNADGGEAEMCGNGARCFGSFLIDLNIMDKHSWVEVLEGEIVLKRLNQNDISVSMPKPKDLRWNQTLTLDSKTWVYDFLNTGVPHFVTFVDQFDDEYLKTLAPLIRYHKNFSPKGTNVNFVVVKEDYLMCRTYERGVEGETLACGTGVTAAALAAVKKGILSSPITILPTSGIPLIVNLNFNGDHFDNITLSGPTTKVFEGTIHLYVE